MCSHTKASYWVLIKGSQHFSQDQEVINEFKTSQNPINTPINMFTSGRKNRKEKQKEERIRIDKKKESNNNKKYKFRVPRVKTKFRGKIF